MKQDFKIYQKIFNVAKDEARLQAGQTSYGNVFNINIVLLYKELVTSNKAKLLIMKNVTNIEGKH